jgi:hypothetical protein
VSARRYPRLGTGFKAPLSERVVHSSCHEIPSHISDPAGERDSAIRLGRNRCAGRSLVRVPSSGGIEPQLAQLAFSSFGAGWTSHCGGMWTKRVGGGFKSKHLGAWKPFTARGSLFSACERRGAGNKDTANCEL